MVRKNAIIFLTFIIFRGISNWRYGRNYPYINCKDNVPTIASVKPYTPLELEGRDLYIREGCNACHTQMIRPFRDEVVRYNGKTVNTLKLVNLFMTDHSYGVLEELSQICIEKEGKTQILGISNTC